MQKVAESRKTPQSSRWTSMSDEQLLQVAFLSNDPSSLSDILSELPASNEIPEVEFAYDTSETTGVKVRCVHCRFDNHNRGFVLQFSNGSRILVGGTCGKKRYGADFQRVEKDFQTARERAHYLKRRRQTIAAAPGFVNELDRLLGHPAFAAQKRVKRDLSSSMTELVRNLNELTDDGSLYLPTKVRDHRAEEQRYSAWERKMRALTQTELSTLKRQNRHLPPQGHIYRDQDEPFWAVQGLGFFRSGHPADVQLTALYQRATSALATLGNSVEPGLNDMRAFFKGMNDLLDEIENVVSRLRLMPLAFEPTNLSKLAEWANKRLEGSYRYDGLSIIHTIASETNEFRIPLSMGYPDMTFIQDFRSHMNKSEP